MADQTVATVCTWTPSNFINLADAVAWPVVVLILGAAVGIPLLRALKTLLAKRVLKEISAGASGVNAVFEAEQQVAATEITSVAASYRSVTLPEHMSVEHIRRTHAEHETPQSIELYNAIKHHMEALALPADEALDLLERDNAFLQQALFVHHVNKSLFRSQYIFLSEHLSEEKTLSLPEIKAYFERVQETSRSSFEGWDHIQYIAYLAKMRLIEEKDSGYKLTPSGSSYLKVMRKNPHLIDELSKL